MMMFFLGYDGTGYLKMREEDIQTGTHERFQVSVNKGWIPVSSGNWNRNPKPRGKA